jgi:2-polyprenyl-3-methyl-5-hydroxy-6-metoxy-1,4-benzoquinol methylase
MPASQPPETADPALLNGDLPMSHAQIAAYMAHHAARNARNAQISQSVGIRTHAAPVWGLSTATGASPARILLGAFYTHLAHTLAPAFTDRPVAIVDLGAGGGARLHTFAHAGFHGDYIGIDIAHNPKWPTAPSPGPARALHPRLIVADLHTFNERSLPPIDLLISTTALEHLRDDQGIIQRFASRLAPGGVQAHFVPAEAALDLYGPHGWRQYSPLCLRHMFPDADIFRFGGPFSNELHLHAIYNPSRLGRPFMSAKHPRLYGWLRAGALLLDRALGCPRPSMYAVVTKPKPHGTRSVSDGRLTPSAENKVQGRITPTHQQTRSIPLAA